MQPDTPVPNTTPPTPAPAAIPVGPQPVVTTTVTQNPNSSGQGETAVIPEEIKGWSWGGFLWTWIWAIGNSTWIGLLALLPPLQFIMAIILGIKGREWAWKNKHWESVEEFKNTQRNWAKWWLIIMIPLALLGMFGSIFLFVAINPQAQIVKATDAAMRIDLMTVLNATEKYTIDNNMLPWDTDTTHHQLTYSSENPFAKPWFSKLETSGLINQNLFTKFTSPSKYNYILDVFATSSRGYVFYCFRPLSDMYKALAKVSCKGVTDQHLSNVCQPDNEYLCAPDLADPSVKLN